MLKSCELAAACMKQQRQCGAMMELPAEQQQQQPAKFS
jgi:hypothetical protein